MSATRSLLLASSIPDFLFNTYVLSLFNSYKTISRKSVENGTIQLQGTIGRINEKISIGQPTNERNQQGSSNELRIKLPKENHTVNGLAECRNQGSYIDLIITQKRATPKETRHEIFFFQYLTEVSLNLKRKKN